MRIVAGTLKGRRLEGPTWDGVRPTSDRLRETLFNVLGQRLEVLGHVGGALAWIGIAGVLEIAPLDAYRVILYVDESDIDELRVGQQGTLMLTAKPGELHALRVTLVTSVAQVRDGKNLFRVEAALQRQDATLRPGMEGVAKVYVGERKLVWIWTHRLFDWLRLNIWTWLGW